jgi:hypothetical protein
VALERVLAVALERGVRGYFVASVGIVVESKYEFVSKQRLRILLNHFFNWSTIMNFKASRVQFNNKGEIMRLFYIWLVSNTDESSNTLGYSITSSSCSCGCVVSVSRE